MGKLCQQRIPGGKFQAPDSKLKINSKAADEENFKPPLTRGSGILEFGIWLLKFIWNLESGTWNFPPRRLARNSASMETPAPMSSPRRQRQRGIPAWKKFALWSLAALPLLLLAGYFVARMWIASYLRSDDFRRFVSRATAHTLKAEGEFAPLHFTGMNIYSDGFKARGSEEAAFSGFALDQIRADLSLRRWRERVWQVDRIEAQRVEVHLDGSRIALERTPQKAPAPTTGHKPGGGWLPNRLEIATAAIKEVNLSWDGGSLRRMSVVANQKETGWEITGTGGRIEHGALPGADLVAMRLHYKEPSIFVQNAEIRQGAAGTISVEGEVRTGEEIDLRAKLAGIDLTPFLNSDWRLRLHGKVAGDVRVQHSLNTGNGPVISGSLQLSEGQIEALPVLNEIANFTTLQRYRRLTLSRASADFRHENGTLRATNFVVESDGLIRIEGGFTIAKGIIDGAFQVGVAASGAESRVFTEARGGYVWTPMRLQGPLESPGEDLSPRLAAAAGGAVIEKVGETVNKAIETGKDVIKGAFDRLMPLFK